MMYNNFLIVGSGITGCVIAHELADEATVQGDGCKDDGSNSKECFHYVFKLVVGLQS